MTKNKKKQSIPEEPLGQNTFDEFKKKYQHDAFCKDKLRNRRKAKKFLEYILKPEVQELLDIEKLEIEPESFVDEALKRLYADVMYRIPLKNSNESIVVYILIELKTDNDRWTIFQMAKYVVRIWDREWKIAEKEKRFETFLFPMVIPIIFHHGEEIFTAPMMLNELVRVLKGMEPYTLNMKAMLFDVTPLAPKDFPGDLELCVLLMVLQTVFSTNVAERLMEIYRKLRPTLHLPESQREWQDALFYAVTSAKHFPQEEFKNVIKQTKKEGVVTMSTSVIDALYAEGIAKGEAKGEARGEAKVAKFGRDAVLDVLRIRFKKIPKRIETVVQRMNDPIALKSLHADALTCQTLEKFAEALQ